MIANRSEQCVWGTTPGANEGDADPLTTAYVLNTLKYCEYATVLDQLNFDGKEGFMSTYWPSSLGWLRRNFDRNGGWWLFETADSPSPGAAAKKYSVTVDILCALAPYYKKDSQLTPIVKRLYAALTELWNIHGDGIPAGVDVGLDDELDFGPDVTTTALFCLAFWHMRDYFGEESATLQNRFLDNLDALTTKYKTDAAGFSILLNYLGSIQRQH